MPVASAEATTGTGRPQNLPFVIFIFVDESHTKTSCDPIPFSALIIAIGGVEWGRGRDLVLALHENLGDWSQLTLAILDDRVTNIRDYRAAVDVNCWELTQDNFLICL